MIRKIPVPLPSRIERGCALGLFLLCLGFSLWGVHVGWESGNLPGLEFRQAQTAISAHFIQETRDFSIDYPTPVLGKPWSIPMEFPLYQWTAVAVSDATGIDLTKAGRLVSIACFYLSLPAVFQLLGRMGVASGRRWWVLAIIVTCPLYIFYSRAFLIETMAMMFGVWFWLAFEKTVEDRSGVWLAVALIAGTGVGLVKVTTFVVYLVPVGWWATQRLKVSWATKDLKRDCVWMALALVLPLGIAWWWIQHSDAVKALNPSAQFLRSDQLREFTLGTLAVRLSPGNWWQKWKIVSEDLVWAPALIGAVVVALLAGQSRARDMMRLLLWFVAALAIFPMLYALHEYYFVANGLLLLVALGFVLVGMAEGGRPVWLVAVAAIAMAGAQVFAYLGGYYVAQSGLSRGGDSLSSSLHGLTKPSEVLVITGQDWNSMTPYYAQRRALMIRTDAEENRAQLEAAFAALKGETIGALVLADGTKGRADILRRAEALGIDPVPLYRWREFSVHVPQHRREIAIRHLTQTGYAELSWAPGVALPTEHLEGEWIEVAKLPAHQRHFFREMNPEPVRFFSTFGLGVENREGGPKLGAHPETRLVFRLPAGPHRLRTTVVFAPDSYEVSLPVEQRTDGVEITLTALGAGEVQQVLFSRRVNPRDNASDRGLVPIKVEFNLEEPAEVELAFGPGPAGSDVRDWIWLGRLVFD